MTSEELERAIDFLLKSQARFDTKLEAYVQEGKERQDRTDEQLSRLSDRVDAFADTQAELMRVFTMYMESEAARQARAEEAQARVNESLAVGQARLEESLARTNESLRVSIGELADRQTKTEEALARLADAQAQSERSLDRLTRIVEGERGR